MVVPVMSYRADVDGLRGVAMNLRASAKPRGPDFLVVGAQRSGTSWLYFTLKRHPELWLPPIKELHYFDKLAGRTWEDQRQWRRAWSARWSIRDFWILRYFLHDDSEDWYASLFHQAQQKGRVAGEITPAYATLDEETFRRIRGMNRDIKIVFIMRDPVERAWSAIRRSVSRKKRSQDSVTLRKVVAMLRRPNSAARSAYIDTIMRLEAVFPASQLHFCFFDDLRDRPEKFLSDILEFLKVDVDEAKKILLPPMIKSSGSRSIPPELEVEMAKQYLPMIRELCDRFDGPPQRWLLRTERLISS